MLNSSGIQTVKLFLLKRRLLFILIAFLVLTIFYAFLLHSYGFGSKIILFESTLAFACLAFFAGILFRIHHYYHSKSAVNFVHLSTLLVFSLGYLGLHQSLSATFIQNKSFLAFADQTMILRVVLTFLLLLCCVNQFWIDKHLLLIEKRNAAFLENEKQLARLELINVKQQIQPHFLFNSLNSINALIGSKPKEARNMVLMLSDYLRLSIQKKENDMVSLAEEIQFLELYLGIEKVRFGDRLQIEKSLPANVDDILIPAQLLQPIMENAVKYGIYGNTDELVIRLAIERREQTLLIEVSNPYDALSVAASKGTGFGLHAVRQKLRLSYGRDDLLQINKEPELFTIRIQIPLLHEV